MRHYSIAEARQNLAALVHEAEEAGPVTLTRRGKPVAVLLSEHEYALIKTGEPTWWDEHKRWRVSHVFSEEGLSDAEVEFWRDRSPGREVDL